MKAYLMHQNQDFDLRRELPRNQETLTQDLELDTLLAAMALGDEFLFEVSKRAILSSLDEPAAIIYRQQILHDCMAQPEVVRDIYAVAVEAVQGEKQIYRYFRASPSGILRRAIEVLQLFVGQLRRLRQIADEHAGKFASEGLTRFFAMLAKELGNEYFQVLDEHLRRLRFRDGVLISAELGQGAKGVRYTLRTPGAARQSWKERIGIGPRSSYTFEIAPCDEAGARALSELADRGTNLVANAVAQSTDHILSFFTLLCSELGFYVSCLNLHDQLVAKGEPTCTPLPLQPSPPALTSIIRPCSEIHRV